VTVKLLINKNIKLSQQLSCGLNFKDYYSENLDKLYWFYNSNLYIKVDFKNF